MTIKKKKIIVDIDGTLALNKTRSPYDWARVSEDIVNQPIAELVRKLSVNFEIVLFSGRDEICLSQTVAWLEKI